MFEINAEYIKAVASKGKSAKRHEYYDDATEHAEEMGVHVSGTCPGDLLKKARPNEPEDVRQYREDVWEPVTKAKSKKVISVINRIFNPRMYAVEIAQNPTGVIPDEETLDKYLFENYPFYLSVMSFIKEVFTKRILEDPNAVIVVRPVVQIKKDTEFVRPVPVIYSSDQLLDFDPDNYYIIDITPYQNNREHETIKKLLVVDDTSFNVYDREGELIEDESYDHNLGRTPAFRLGGVVTGKDYPYYYESYISGILPHWNKAVTIQSDLDAQIVLHAYLEKWEYDSVQCPGCGGDGVVYDKGDHAEHRESERQCSRCGGVGKIAKNPFDIYTINRDALNPDAPVPIPPAGYIEKPIEILTKLREEVDLNIKEGLSAINMEIVDLVPEIQSGIAKTIDRQDLDSFLMQYSNHIFDYVLPNIIDMTIQWRYVVPGMIKDLKKYPYIIKKPVRFDVLSVQHLMVEFAQAKETKLDNNVIAAYEIDIIEKLFSGATKQKAQTIVRLDPYTGMNTDEMMTLRSQDIITEKDWYIKTHMGWLVEIAISRDTDKVIFLELDLIKQEEIISKIADEQLAKRPKIETLPVEP